MRAALGVVRRSKELGGGARAFAAAAGQVAPVPESNEDFFALWDARATGLQLYQRAGRLARDEGEVSVLRWIR